MRPGSRERIELLRLRASAGLPLWEGLDSENPMHPEERLRDAPIFTKVRGQVARDRAARECEKRKQQQHEQNHQ